MGWENFIEKVRCSKPNGTCEGNKWICFVYETRGGWEWLIGEVHNHISIHQSCNSNRCTKVSQSWNDKLDWSRCHTLTRNNFRSQSRFKVDKNVYRNSLPVDLIRFRWYIAYRECEKKHHAHVKKILLLFFMRIWLTLTSRPHTLPKVCIHRGCNSQHQQSKQKKNTVKFLEGNE